VSTVPGLLGAGTALGQVSVALPVTWPGGADLAPGMLYERIRTGAWPEEDVAV
jgi:hypothetical protein